MAGIRTSASSQGAKGRTHVSLLNGLSQLECGAKISAEAQTIFASIQDLVSLMVRSTEMPALLGQIGLFSDSEGDAVGVNSVGQWWAA